MHIFVTGGDQQPRIRGGSDAEVHLPVIVGIETLTASQDLVEEPVGNGAERGGTKDGAILRTHALHGPPCTDDNWVGVDQGDPDAQSGGCTHHVLQQVPKIRASVELDLTEVFATETVPCFAPIEYQ